MKCPKCKNEEGTFYEEVVAVVTRVYVVFNGEPEVQEERVEDVKEVLHIKCGSCKYKGSAPEFFPE